MIKIYWSIFKTQNSLISTFFIINRKNKYNEYKLYIIKIMLYISSSTFSIIFDILFYNDKTMHKLIEDNGKFNLKYKLPRIIILGLISYLFSKFFELLIDYQDELIDLKNNLGEIDQENTESNNSRNETKIYSYIKVNVREDKIKSTNRSLFGTLKLNNKNIKNSTKNDYTMKKSKTALVNQIPDNNNENNNNNQIQNTNDNNRSNETKKEKEEMASNIETNFRRNRIIFYVIILIFQLFSWYFISCFCALYKKTQKHLGMDIGFGIGIDLISSLFISFYILIIRIIIIRSRFCNFCIKIYNCIKCLKNIKFLKCMMNYIEEEVIIFLFQKTIELLIAYYIINKIPFLSDF